MPRPTDNLRADHHVIEQCLDVLLGMAAHVRGGGAFPAADCAVVLRFLREFLLPIHFRKENEMLWPAVALRGEDRVAALVGDLLRRQEDVVELVHTLVLFWEPVADLTAAERTGFAATAEALTRKLRRLQELEELDLFGACDTDVPADDQLDWIARFAQLESERTPLGTWRGAIGRLAADWRG